MSHISPGDRLSAASRDRRDRSRVGFLALPGGELAFLLVHLDRHQDSGFEHHTLLLVGRDGELGASRMYDVQVGRTIGIAVSRGVVGVQWTDRDLTSPRWFLPITGPEANQAPAALDLASTPICKSPPRTSAVSILAMSGGRDMPGSTDPRAGVPGR